MHGGAAHAHAPPNARPASPQDGKLVSKSSRMQLPKTGLDSGAVITLNNLVCEVDHALEYEDFR